MSRFAPPGEAGSSKELIEKLIEKLKKSFEIDLKDG